jgi:ribosome-associated protein
MPFDIPESELDWRFDTSGGPGGQHANRSNTRVELRFDILASVAFDDATRQRLVDRLGSEIRLTESGSRSQTRNRERALARLQGMLDDAGRSPPPPRRRTRPSAGARKRRLADKRARSRTKRDRKPPGFED